jgi:hypothetical protein
MDQASVMTLQSENLETVYLTCRLILPDCLSTPFRIEIPVACPATSCLYGTYCVLTAHSYNHKKDLLHGCADVVLLPLLDAAKEAANMLVERG